MMLTPGDLVFTRKSMYDRPECAAREKLQLIAKDTPYVFIRFHPDAHRSEDDAFYFYCRIGIVAWPRGFVDNNFIL